MKKYLFCILALCFVLTSCFFNDVENADSNTPQTTTSNYLLSYNFDESSGTIALDSSGNKFNGVLSSAIRTVGKVNRAVSLPLGNSYVFIDQLPLIMSYLGSLSIYSWIKPSELNDTKEYAVFSSYFSISLAIEIINNRFTILFNDIVYLQSSTLLTTDTWVHFVLTSDGNKIILYLNGQEDCSTNMTFPATNSEGCYSIGDSESGNSFLGVVDEFNIMKIALTADQIQDLYSHY